MWRMGRQGHHSTLGGVKQEVTTRQGTVCRNLSGASETSRYTWCNLRPGAMPGQLLMLVFSAKNTIDEVFIAITTQPASGGHTASWEGV